MCFVNEHPKHMFWCYVYFRSTWKQNKIFLHAFYLLVSLFSLPSLGSRDRCGTFIRIILLIHSSALVRASVEKSCHRSNAETFSHFNSQLFFIFDESDKMCSRVWNSTRFYHQSVIQWTFVAHPYFWSDIKIYLGIQLSQIY